LARSENAANLKEPYHSMLVELLNFHDKKEKKLNDLKSFTVGTHPDHPETRCFMIVKGDGSQEDFSCIKCIQNMQKEYEN
jgi:DNA-directed RNA polymerase-4 subunit 1